MKFKRGKDLRALLLLKPLPDGHSIIGIWVECSAGGHFLSFGCFHAKAQRFVFSFFLFFYYNKTQRVAPRRIQC